MLWIIMLSINFKPILFFVIIMEGF